MLPVAPAARGCLAGECCCTHEYRQPNIWFPFGPLEIGFAAAYPNCWSYLDQTWPLLSLSKLMMIEMQVASSKACCSFRWTATAVYAEKVATQSSGVRMLCFLLDFISSLVLRALLNYAFLNAWEQVTYLPCLMVLTRCGRKGGRPDTLVARGWVRLPLPLQIGVT